MDRVQFTLAVLLNLFSMFIFGVPGEAVVFFPPEPRAMNQYFVHQPVSRNVIPQGFVPHEHVFPQERMVPEERVRPILHTSAVNPLVPPPASDRLLGETDTANEIFITEEDHLRAAKSGYEYPAHPTPYPQTPSYGYTPQAPSYNSAPAASASAPGYSPTAPVPAPVHPLPTSKFSILKPDLTSLIKPVTTKVASKVSGLLGLVLSLFTGSASDDLGLKGIKEVVINGILKPLLVAKGGIKSLISKLTIPLISLLLINLEVLITVWWLWEECPEPVKPVYTYTKPTYAPSYNSYR